MQGTISSIMSGALGLLDFILTTLLSTLILFIFYRYLKTPKGLPPGPPGLPIVGYLPFLGKLPHLKFFSLSKKYGPVFSVYLGNRLVLVLNNYDVIKEAFVNQAEVFSGRPKMRFSMAALHKYSVLGIDGVVWKDQQRFISTLFRDLGVGKMSIEPQIMDEIQHYIAELEALNGEAANFSHLLMQSVLNNVNILIFGHRFEYRDPWLLETTSVISTIMEKSTSMGVLMFFPWLTNIPGIASLFSQYDLITRRAALENNIQDIMAERKKNYEDLKRDNYINAFILEQKARENQSNNLPFPDKALEENVIVLMGGGMDTTCGYLMWIILYMAAYPVVQAKVQQEIDYVIGTDRTPCYLDRLRTPYTEATILEVQRMETLGPCGMPHRCMKDCNLLGFQIPKDTIVLGNMWAVNNDENIWTDLQTFRPERFLAPNGQFDKKEHIIPFSMGKRECLAKNLAKMELYLYFTSMLQKFCFTTEDGLQPNLERIYGLIAKPKYFKPRVVLRTSK